MLENSLLRNYNENLKQEVIFAYVNSISTCCPKYVLEISTFKFETLCMQRTISFFEVKWNGEDFNPARVG